MRSLGDFPFVWWKSLRGLNVELCPIGDSELGTTLRSRKAAICFFVTGGEHSIRTFLCAPLKLLISFLIVAQILRMWE